MVPPPKRIGTMRYQCQGGKHRGDGMLRFSTSEVGTKRTSSEVRLESAFRGNADYRLGASISPFEADKGTTVQA
jgi:hypothetical protein